MRNRTHHELTAILRSFARHGPEPLEAVVAELKAEEADRPSRRNSRRRSAAVDKALAAVTNSRSDLRFPAWIAISHLVRGGNQ